MRIAKDCERESRHTVGRAAGSIRQQRVEKEAQREAGACIKRLLLPLLLLLLLVVVVVVLCRCRCSDVAATLLYAHSSLLSAPHSQKVANGEHEERRRSSTRVDGAHESW
ncbi:unnamed protein product [Toxocara canis]|uniref:Uncharacterized protein n=1 Tax=Toxocara canis TaxID=6265 RepID=A0A183TZM8_TOXCA|nr:unnamed protein product [Toxocara canis]